MKVAQVAKLANLPLSEKEEDKYSQQLSKILEYIDQLNRADTLGAEPTFNVTSNVNVLRKDETTAGLNQEDAIANASQKQGGFFATKGVFKNE